MSQYSPSVTPPTHPLSALSAAAAPSKTVTVRGASFTLRLLSTAEVYQLLSCVPVVQPPTITINGVQTENLRDPAFIAAQGERQRAVRLGELAIAMSLPGPDGRGWSELTDAGQRRAYLQHAQQQLERALLASEVAALERVLRDLEEKVEGDIRGNSSGRAAG